MSPQQLHVLRHALGLDHKGHGKPYRRHYCCGPGHDGFDACRDLVALGLMEEHPPTTLTGGDHLFLVNDAGRSEIMKHKEHEPKLTRSQQRYRNYLRSELNMPFADYLVSEYCRP